jgi:hypothetical protein
MSGGDIFMQLIVVAGSLALMGVGLALMGLILYGIGVAWESLRDFLTPETKIVVVRFQEMRDGSTIVTQGTTTWNIPSSRGGLKDSELRAMGLTEEAIRDWHRLPPRVDDGAFDATYSKLLKKVDRWF